MENKKRNSFNNLKQRLTINEEISHSPTILDFKGKIALFEGKKRI